MSRWMSWRQRAQESKRYSHALYLAVRDPRVPWYAKAVVVLVVGYALSPIDLIPDFIPVLGYLDDLLLLPLGIALAIRLIPADIWRDCLTRAAAAQATRTLRSAGAGHRPSGPPLGRRWFPRWPRRSEDGHGDGPRTAGGERGRLAHPTDTD